MTRHAYAAKLTEAEWAEIRAKPCPMCGMPYHRFCGHDPEHDWSATACINALQGRIEDLGTTGDDLAEAARDLMAGDHWARNGGGAYPICCNYCGFSWPCDTERTRQALVEWKRVKADGALEGEA